MAAFACDYYRSVVVVRKFMDYEDLFSIIFFHVSFWAFWLFKHANVLYKNLCLDEFGEILQ